MGCDGRVVDAPSALGFGLPSSSGSTTRCARSHGESSRAVHAEARGDLRPALRFRAATGFVVRASRLLGQPIPLPERVPIERADVVARWAADMARAEGACLVRASVSMALRIALAAEEEGIHLHGVTLMGGSEPVTPTKMRAMERSGARFVPTYSFTEGGSVGMGCADPADEGDVHFFSDLLALIQHPVA